MSDTDAFETGGRPFAIKDCAVIAIATGRQAWTAEELREGIAESPAESLYHHFWTGLLQPRFEEREYNNDFAGWAAHYLHEHRLGEQLAVIDPTAYPDLEALRTLLLELLDHTMEKDEILASKRADRPFDFIRSQIVIFDSRWRIAQPHELLRVVGELPLESIFYHFIDARRRDPPGQDDFSAWLKGFGEPMTELVSALQRLDYYFDGLSRLRDDLQALLEHYLPRELQS